MWDLWKKVLSLWWRCPFGLNLVSLLVPAGTLSWPRAAVQEALAQPPQELLELVEEALVDVDIAEAPNVPEPEPDDTSNGEVEAVALRETPELYVTLLE